MSMLLFPIIVGHRVKIQFSIKDFLLGIIVSVTVLFPFYLFVGGNLKAITFYSVIFQLFIVALPEEFFFRGFLQDSLGKHLKSIVLVSILFSITHLPKAFFFNDWISLLSFFPSLIMGWLYMKTKNILPGTIFHLCANIVYQYTSVQ
jgi:membrane protease YdiL (CAAX protease family)